MYFCSMKYSLSGNFWWLFPALVALILLALSRNALALIVGSAFFAAAEALYGILALKAFSGRTRFALVAPLVLCIVLAGTTLLFLERYAFKIPLMLFATGIVVFVHYSLRQLHSAAEEQFRPIVSDGYRLLALSVTLFSGILFYADIFYFGIATAYFAIPLLIIPGAMVMLQTWIANLPFREQLLHTLVFCMLILETGVALVLLPFSYGVSALYVTLAYFLYSEYAVVKNPADGPHSADRTISFLVTGIVVFFFILVTRIR